MAENNIEYLGKAHLFRADFRGATPATLMQSLRETLDSSPRTKSVYVTDLVTDTTAASNPLHIAISNGDTIEQFLKALPPPTEWLTIDGRRLVRYDAPTLRAYLDQR